MKPTADQVIQEFDELSVEDQQRVYVTIVERSGGRSTVFEGHKTEFVGFLSGGAQVRQEFDTPKESGRTGSQKVLWKGILIDFVPNDYVSSYQEIWRLESLLGPDVVREGLSKYPVLDANFIERLFDQSTYSFYVDRSGSYLLSDTNELFESDFGLLIQLTALEALQRYGLSLLEESKEKGYVRL